MILRRIALVAGIAAVAASAGCYAGYVDDDYGYGYAYPSADVYIGGGYYPHYYPRYGYGYPRYGYGRVYGRAPVYGYYGRAHGYGHYGRSYVGGYGHHGGVYRGGGAYRGGGYHGGGHH